MGLRPKCTALIRALAVMLVAFSATTGIFAGSALAAGVCTVAPGSGVVGSDMALSCTGFASNETVRVYWDTEPTSPSTPGAKGSFQTNGTGVGSKTLAVPDGVSGNHTVWFFGASSAMKTSVTFAVVPNITTSSPSGAPASNLSAYLTGYPSGASVTVKWYHDVSTVVDIKTVTIGSTGKASAISTVPDAVAGAHTVEADDADAGTTNPTTTFTVVPGIKISPTSGTVGNNVTVTVRGYGAGEVVTIKWVSGGTPVTKATATANGFGKGTASFEIPVSAMGEYEVQGDGTTNDASMLFPVVPSVDLDGFSYFVHDNVAVTLDGYPANTAVTVKWYDTASASQDVGSATTDADGHAVVTFAMPDATRGSHKVEGFANASVKPYAMATVKPSLEINPITGIDGDNVAVHLHGFNANEVVGIQWFATLSTIVEMTPVTVNAKGTGDGSFNVPAGSINGDHQVKANGQQDASATFKVNNPPVNLPAACELDRTEGAIGLELEVTCANYDAGETVNVYWDSAATTAVATFITDNDGEGSTKFNVPAGAANGAHSVLTVGATSAESTSDAFTVVDGPTCTFTDNNATPGTQGVFDDTINFSCSGFLPNELVRVYWDSTISIARASAMTSAAGVVSGTFTIPDATNGAHTVIAKGNTSKYETTGTVSVDAMMSVTPDTGSVNTSPTVRLKGFGSLENVTLQWMSGTTPVGDAKVVRVSSKGTGTTTYSVPPAPAGAFSLKATGATTGATVSQPFTIEAGMVLTPPSGTPPSSLKILLRGYKANEGITVTWEHTPTNIVTLATANADANGTIELDLKIPQASRGLHEVKATGDGGTVTSDMFDVQSSVQMGRINGKVGVTFTYTLKGWGRYENVTLRWYDGDSFRLLEAGPVQVNQFGRAVLSITVPETYAGMHKITATGEGATPTVRQKQFNVIPSVTLSPSSGPIGTTVTVTLKGFGKTGGGAPEDVDIRFFPTFNTSDLLKTVTVDANGSATTTIVIPSSTVKSHKIEAKGASSLVKGYMYFKITAS